MKKRQTYRSFLALSMVALILQATVLKEAYHLLEHSHEQVAHCSITQGHETHLHSEEYAPTDCFVCFFHFAPATLFPGELSIQPPVFTLPKCQFFYQNPLVSRVEWHFHLRGPPCLPA